jgi:hypothetical protein
MSATLTVQFDALSPNNNSEPGDGFSFAYGEIPLADKFLSDNKTDTNTECGLPRASVAICHLTYRNGIRARGIYAIVNRTILLSGNRSDGEILPRGPPRTMSIVVEWRPNYTNVSSIGLAQRFDANFTEQSAERLTAWMFGARTGANCESVRIESVLLSVIADSCTPTPSVCAANSIVMQFADASTLCVQVTEQLQRNGENQAVSITYVGNTTWSGHSGAAIVKFVSIDAIGRVFAIMVQHTNSTLHWSLRRRGLCDFVVSVKLANQNATDFALLSGSIPIFSTVAGSTPTSSTAGSSTSISSTVAGSPIPIFSTAAGSSTSTTSIDKSDQSSFSTVFESSKSNDNPVPVEETDAFPDWAIAVIVIAIIALVIAFLVTVIVVSRRKSSSTTSTTSTSTTSTTRAKSIYSDGSAISKHADSNTTYTQLTEFEAQPKA